MGDACKANCMLHMYANCAHGSSDTALTSTMIVTTLAKSGRQMISL
jgi:hypothetical protein